MRDLPETFWAWLAGFVDGDGCIGFYNNMGYLVARLTIAQKERDVLDYIVEKVGCGSISKRGKTLQGSVMYALVWGSKQTREICRKMLPYLYAKRDKAVKVLNKPKLEGSLRANSVSSHLQYAKVIEMYKTGESALEISRKLPVKQDTVLYWVRSLGISRTLSEAQCLRREREKRI